MPIMRVISAFERQPHQCFAAWPGKDGEVQCPNEYVAVFEVCAKPGFTRLCEEHKAGFSDYAKHIGAGHDLLLWTRTEWEAGREAVVLQRIAAADAANGGSKEPNKKSARAAALAELVRVCESAKAAAALATSTATARCCASVVTGIERVVTILKSEEV